MKGPGWLLRWSAIGLSLGLWIWSLTLPAYSTPFSYGDGILDHVEVARGGDLAIAGWAGVFALMFGWFANPILLVCLMRLASSRPYSRDQAHKWLVVMGIAVVAAVPCLWPGDLEILDEHGFLGETTALVGVRVWLLSLLPPFFPLIHAALTCPWTESAEFEEAKSARLKAKVRPEPPFRP